MDGLYLFSLIFRGGFPILQLRNGSNIELYCETPQVYIRGSMPLETFPSSHRTNRILNFYHKVLAFLGKKANFGIWRKVGICFHHTKNVWLKHRKIGAFCFFQYLSAGRDLSGKKGGCKFEGESNRTAAAYVIKERTTALCRPLQLFPPKFSGIFAGMFPKTAPSDEQFSHSSQCTEEHV